MQFAEPKKPPRRRWFQYSLRSILVLTTLSAIALAAWSTYRKHLRVQNRALPQLTKLKAEVDVQPVGPEWLRALPGGEDLFKVVSVNLEHHRLEDEDLACLEHLPYLERLYLAATAVSNKGLAHVATCKRLKRLSLWKTRITDLGMDHLRGLEDLELLDIQDTKVTEAALAHLRYLPRLKKLIQTIELSDEGIELLARFPHRPVTSVHARGITEQGLWALTGLRRLETLVIADAEMSPESAVYFTHFRNLRHLAVHEVVWSKEAVAHVAALPRIQRVDEAGFSHSGITLDEFTQAWGNRLTHLTICTYHVRGTAKDLQVSLDIRIPNEELSGLCHCGNLTSLDFRGEQFGDAGMKQVAKLARLTRLSLEGTRVGDAGVRLLHGHPQLERVVVRGSRVTPEGRRALRASLPNGRSVY